MHEGKITSWCPLRTHVNFNLNDASNGWRCKEATLPCSWPSNSHVVTFKIANEDSSSGPRAFLSEIRAMNLHGCYRFAVGSIGTDGHNFGWRHEGEATSRVLAADITQSSSRTIDVHRDQDRLFLRTASGQWGIALDFTATYYCHIRGHQRAKKHLYSCTSPAHSGSSKVRARDCNSCTTAPPPRCRRH